MKKSKLIMGVMMCSLLFVGVESILFWYVRTHEKSYDLYTKSTALGFVRKGGLYYHGILLKPWYMWPFPRMVEDYCYNDKDLYHPTLQGDSLQEYVSENGLLTFGDRKCDCTDGACKKPPAVTLCNDSDNGKNIFAKGSVLGVKTGENFPSQFTDECDPLGSSVLEGFCVGNIHYDYEWTLCEGGCQNGRCIQGLPNFLPKDWGKATKANPQGKKICYDSDGGNMPDIKGAVYGNYIGDDKDTFVVVKDSCATNQQLNEVYCIDEQRAGGTSVQCKKCVDGACTDY